jgi:hypothetical protein
VDCDDAEEKARAKGKVGDLFHIHCHSDDCEECFPK